MATHTEREPTAADSNFFIGEGEVPSTYSKKTSKDLIKSVHLSKSVMNRLLDQNIGYVMEESVLNSGYCTPNHSPTSRSITNYTVNTFNRERTS